MGQVQPKELRIQGRGRVYLSQWDPGVQLFRQPDQVVGAGEHDLDQHPEQADQDGHLDDHWAQAAEGAHPGLPVQAHGLLGNSGPVPGVPVLNLLQLGLQRTHGPHLLQLLQCQRQRGHPDNGGQYDDRQTHLAEEDGVEHHQAVEHGPNYQFGPEE